MLANFKPQGAMPHLEHRQAVNLLFKASAHRWIDHCLWCITSATPDLRLPSQPESITALCLVCC